jgi:hypothetical protein
LSSGIPLAECDAYIEFFDATGGMRWNRCNDSRLDPCSCPNGGAGCGYGNNDNGDRVNHITQLMLSENNLEGSIPESFSKLTVLRTLYLDNNGLWGSIPASLAELTALTSLTLYMNNLTGRIPALPFNQYTQYCCLGGDIPQVSDSNHFACPLPADIGHCSCKGGAGCDYGCNVTCTAPTPAPTPTMFSCDQTTGRCVPDPHGTQAPGDCISTCQCVTSHNCGQLNGTASCGAVLAGCNVCDMCCKPWITVQASCDGCFAAPVPNGCGGKSLLS